MEEGKDRRYPTARQALAGSGWQRSVGGVSPYLGIRARSGESRKRIDALAVELQLFELPSARGCTYVVPADHFALGLAVGRPFGSTTERATARKLGVEDAEVDALKEAVVVALAAGPLSPADLKTVLGNKVRNLGEEAFVRDDLGDACSFSLDSPASRMPRISALRELGSG